MQVIFRTQEGYRVFLTGAGLHPDPAFVGFVETKFGVLEFTATPGPKGFGITIRDQSGKVVTTNMTATFNLGLEVLTWSRLL